MTTHEQDHKSHLKPRQFPSEAFVVDKLVNAVQTSKLVIKASKDTPKQGRHEKALRTFLHCYVATSHERAVWGHFHKLEGMSPADREIVEQAAKEAGMTFEEFSSREILEQLRHFLVANEIPFLAKVTGPVGSINSAELKVPQFARFMAR